MKRSFIVLLLFLAYWSYGQKGIDELVNAEKLFAAYSVKHGTKAAFLQFLDSNGVVFDQGKAVNGIEIWKKRDNRPFVLNWAPGIVEIASSNDFGYTVGPWELRSKDSVIGTGRFTTVWHINSRGEWKFLVDLGVSIETTREKKVVLHKIKTKKQPGDSSEAEIVKAEQDFVELLRERGNSAAYSRYLSGSSILLRNLQHQAVGKLKQSESIMSTPAGIRYNIEGSGMASSGDLAFVYGNVSIGEKSDNYLRIWRKEKGGWRIAVEVIRY